MGCAVKTTTCDSVYEKDVAVYYNLCQAPIYEEQTFQIKSLGPPDSPSCLVVTEGTDNQSTLGHLNKIQWGDHTL